MIVGLPLQELLHPRAVHEILKEAWLEGREQGREESLKAVVSRKPLLWPFASSANASAALTLVAVSSSRP